MFYLDAKFTKTRRDSSLVGAEHSWNPAWSKTTNVLQNSSPRHRTSRKISKPGVEPATSGSVKSCIAIPVTPVANRHAVGSIRKQIVTAMFEVMLGNIVASWETVEKKESVIDSPIAATTSKIRKVTIARKPKKYKSKMNPESDVFEDQASGELFQPDPMTITWWSDPDEKVKIQFRNGNIYTGNVSMKCMQGEGRFQWADGTVYMGMFEDNKICGKGRIEWKDNSWYEGEFFGNLRHGHGLYVDPHEGRSYTGSWHYGTKHGSGTMFYTGDCDKYYEGDWVRNVKHGNGTREYDGCTGYKGEWDYNVREGTGSMIWPNHDFYIGGWRNGKMSGYGRYIWQATYNNTMSLPQMVCYVGQWLDGRRDGPGKMELGFGVQYQGLFKNDKKHGIGQLVTNSGAIIIDKNLFYKDQFTGGIRSLRSCDLENNESLNFLFCDESVGLLHHIHQALSNIIDVENDTEEIIDKYFKNNNMVTSGYSLSSANKGWDLLPGPGLESEALDIDEIVEFEKSSLLYAIHYYYSELREIYYKYATICNKDQIHFKPVMIRLFLWQFYFDCDVHKKGLTLVQIDRIFHSNSDWLSKSPHNPFEPIQYWQFLESLISVACKIHCKSCYPKAQSERTLVATAFRTFMEQDAIPAIGRCKGRLTQDLGRCVPLMRVYELYRAIGEPHTVRQFQCATRCCPVDTKWQQPQLVDTPDEFLPLGSNRLIFGNEMVFVNDPPVPFDRKMVETQDINWKPPDGLYLYKLGNVSSKTIVQLFAKIFGDGKICGNGKVLNLDIEVTFFEFFEAFIGSTEESIKLTEEELNWRKKFATHI